MTELKCFEVLSQVLYLFGWFSALVFDEPDFKKWQIENMILALIWPVLVPLWIVIFISDEIKNKQNEKIRLKNLKEQKEEEQLRVTQELVAELKKVREAKEELERKQR